MALTFDHSETRQLAAVLDEVTRLTREIRGADGLKGTPPPDPCSRSALYERVGIQLVAMYNCGVSPLHAIKLIRQVATDPNQLEVATLIAMIGGDAAEAGAEVPFLSPAEGIN